MFKGDELMPGHLAVAINYLVMSHTAKPRSLRDIAASRKTSMLERLQKDLEQDVLSVLPRGRVQPQIGKNSWRVPQIQDF